MGVFDSLKVFAHLGLFISMWVGYHLVLVDLFLFRPSKVGEKDRVKKENSFDNSFRGGVIL
jgi:hypothetical protein